MPSPSTAAPQAPCSGALPQRQQQGEENGGGGSAALIPEHLTWTARREERLRYVQRQLTAAQAAWSVEQELWIDEVTHLEGLKRKCVKAEKKVAGGNGAGGSGGRKGSLGGRILLKRGSWRAGGGDRSGKGKERGSESPLGSPKAGVVPGAVDEAVFEEGDDEEDRDGEAPSPTTSTSPSSRRPSISSLLKRTMSLSSKNNPTAGPTAGAAAAPTPARQSLSRSITFDDSQARHRPTLASSSAYRSYSGSSSEVKGSGKFLERRGSSR